MNKLNSINLEKLKNLLKMKNKNNDLFTLWISDSGELPELQHISLKSMLLTGHNVTLYTYDDLNNVPKGINVRDGNEILDESKIFKYKEGFNKGSYSGFSNWFRVKCLYEKGIPWFDCDILAMKNINDIKINGSIISSEYDPEGNICPNLGFLRLEKKDKLVKALLDYIENIEDIENTVKHGDTGPRLLKFMMDGEYKEYYNYLMNPNFISSINYSNYIDFLKPTEELIKKLKFDEIWGFHIWNAMFREYGNEHEKVTNGFYYDLKLVILTSSTEKEYENHIRNMGMH